MVEEEQGSELFDTEDTNATRGGVATGARIRRTVSLADVLETQSFSSYSMRRSHSLNALDTYDCEVGQGVEVRNVFLSQLADKVKATFLACQHASAGKKTELLEDLMYNICSKISSHLAAHFGAACRYFQLLADYFGSDAGHQHGAQIQRLCVAVWTHDMLPSIYSLLFHHWIIIYLEHHPTETAVQFNLLLRGCCRLFWSDCQDNSLIFASLYSFICSLIIPSISDATFVRFVNGMNHERIRRDIRIIVLRFVFHYCFDDEEGETEAVSDGIVLVPLLNDPIRLLLMLEGLHDRVVDGFHSSTPLLNASEDRIDVTRLSLQLSDSLVREWCSLLSVLTSEDGRCKYLGSLRQAIPHLQLSPLVLNKAKSALLPLTSPGGVSSTGIQLSLYFQYFLVFSMATTIPYTFVPPVGSHSLFEWAAVRASVPVSKSAT